MNVTQITPKKKVDIDELASWLYDEGFEELIRKANQVCTTYYLLEDKDKDGDPSEKARDARRDIESLSTSLDLYQ